MERNNGKIAIAIVAMFVVALSIVGFTYAYFVANVQGNEGTNSVTVTAGILEIEYENTKSINVSGIAPGWKSDGLHYFNSATGCSAVEGELRCVAEKAATTADVPEGATGAHEPASFKVSTTERNTDTVNYVILLNGITSNFDANDKANLTYALCKGTCDTTKEYADVTAMTKDVIGKDGATVQLISGVETLADGGEQAYQLMVYYANNGAQNSKGKTVHADIDVIGVQEDADGNWVDANGVIVIAAA